MSKVKWDVELNGVILSDNIDPSEELSNAPRPVFLQELELLGLTKKYKVRKTDLPLCWCMDRRYFSNGQLLFETKNAAIFNEPEIIFNDNCDIQVLKPIDIRKVVKKNSVALKNIENEAMDFIRGCYEKYEQSVSDFVVAFSGGKDSQVILDLVSRVLPPESYKAVFTDTGMELPCTKDIVKYTEEEYKYKYPLFQFYQAKSEKESIDMWNQYGPPSRTARWCCSVLKTALFDRRMKEILCTDGQPKLVVFEGVRADESARREAYERIGKGVKHPNLINCRAIFRWNTTEIFLYMFSHEIVMNPAYRYGLSRVGCGVCPFASDWSEYVIWKLYPDITKQYVAVIQRMAKKLGISEKEKIKEYISSGNWKKNSGGRGLNSGKSRVDILSKEPELVCVVTQPRVDWKIWMNTAGELLLQETVDGITEGELKLLNQIVRFTVAEKDNQIRFIFQGMTNRIEIRNILLRVVYKTMMCELCGYCEAECPTGALRVRDELSLDINKCVHCHNCLDVSSRGCIIGHRKQLSDGELNGSNKMKTSGIDKYSTFGLREAWLVNYLEKGDKWFSNYGLGNRQIVPVINWLREAELIDEKEKKTSVKFELMKRLYYKKPLIAWQIIWINLAFNSSIINALVRIVPYDVTFSKKDIIGLVRDHYPSLSEGTVGNPVAAYFNMLKETPLGIEDSEIITDNTTKSAVSKYELSGNRMSSVTRIRIEQVSLISVAYSLYKFAEKEKKYELTVTELRESVLVNPYNILGLSDDDFLKSLRSLQQMNYLTVDLVGGLDNIHLNKDYHSDEILEKMVDRL